MTRTAMLLILAATGCAPLARPPAGAPEFPDGAPIVIVHGAWGGGWAWRGVDSLLTAAGHTVSRPTLTGLGERVHLARPETDLSTHVADVVNHLVFERLEDVVLVGHSYGGMVAMGVAHRVPERVRLIVLIDAFLPEDGESVADAVRGTRMEGWIDGLIAGAEGGLITPSWLGPDDPWPTDVPHPLGTFTEPAVLGSAAARAIPGTYVLTAAPGTDPDDDLFAPFADRARARGWEVIVFDGDHNPQSSARQAIAALLASRTAGAARGARPRRRRGAGCGRARGRAGPGR